jgi:hypothetical protein
MSASQANRSSGYDTNLAAEFYVLSCLHRIGLTATDYREFCLLRQGHRFADDPPALKLAAIWSIQPFGRVDGRAMSSERNS